MSNLHRPSHPFPILLKSVAFSLLGAAAISLSTPTASAGTAELRALQAALNSVPISQATSQELFNAFKAVIAQNTFNRSTKYGVVVGEALKAAGPNAMDAGEFFADAIVSNTDSNANVTSALASPNLLLSLAGKTAGTGAGLNVSQIPDFTAGIAGNTSNPQATATEAAKSAANKPGAGAILGGGASLLVTDADKTAYADSSIKDRRLASAVQDIARYIGATVADTPAYAVNVANLNFRLSVKIAAGTAAGDPTNAGNIIHALFNQSSLNDDGSLSAPTAVSSVDTRATLVRGASTLATTAAAGADIEEIQKIGNAFGQAIATPSANNPVKGQILLSKAASIVKALATAVMNKPRLDRFGAQIAINQDANKRDELAEVSAYVLGGLLGSPELGFVSPPSTPAKIAAAAKKAATTILALITGATSVKPKIVTINRVRTAQGPGQETFAADVAASVALTVLNSNLSADIKTAVRNLLLLTDSRGNPTTANRINRLAGAQILARLNDVYNGVDLNRFEDGNSALGAVSDPETDIHPFS